jgi:hypothetical protein
VETVYKPYELWAGNKKKLVNKNNWVFSFKKKKIVYVTEKF